MLFNLLNDTVDYFLFNLLAVHVAIRVKEFSHIHSELAHCTGPKHDFKHVELLLLLGPELDFLVL
jgi:hypothetical protein